MAMFKKEDMSGELQYIPDLNSPSYELTDDVMLTLGSLRNEDFTLLAQLEEETVEATVKYNTNTQFCPVSPRGPPERRDFVGELNFIVEVDSSDTHKKKYLYSHKLHRIYVDMKCNFSVQFTWDFARSPRPMYVRATTVFSDPTQAEKRVERCIQHTHENQNINPVIVNNVLHSARDINTQGVYYCGDTALPDSWYSVVVQFATTSDAPAKHAYQFVCKNSCSNGINRRSIDIVFTLEDSAGNIYGRQSVGARVCACPRRDMVKDETTEGVYIAGKKRVPSNKIEPAKTKKAKIETTEEDDTVHVLPPIKVIGGKTLTTGLQVMLNMMEQVAAFKRNDPQKSDAYEKAIAELKNTLDGLKNKSHTQ